MNHTKRRQQELFDVPMNCLYTITDSLSGQFGLFLYGWVCAKGYIGIYVDVCVLVRVDVYVDIQVYMCLCVCVCTASLYAID